MGSADTSPDAALALERLTKRYHQAVAVDDFSLTIAPGEFLTLLGPSGSGKTTILMMIAGFVIPTEGSIRVGRREVTRLAPERRNFGMVFQGYALFPHMTVAENIAYPLLVRGRRRGDTATDVAKALDMVRLNGFAGQYPRQLSGGQQQRVAIARALIFQPQILLLDEPLGALDRSLRAEVQVELKQLHNRLGTTFIYVTHDQDEALSMSDRIAVMNGGRLIQCASPRELYEKPVSSFVAQFLGKSNIISGIAAGARGDSLIYKVGEEAFVADVAEGIPALGEPVVFALRPEGVTITSEEPGAGQNRQRGRIIDQSYFGAMTELTIETSSLGIFTVTVPTSARLSDRAKDALVWLSWDPGATRRVTHSHGKIEG